MYGQINSCDFVQLCGVVVEISANKAFKSESQRMAFFILSLSAVFMVVRLSFVVALLTP